MTTYWAYINNNYKWHAWYYYEGEVIVKLGSFNTQEEAQEAESTMEILKKVPLKIYIG